MQPIRTSSYYRHKVTGERRDPADYNYKCPYDEMDQWEFCKEDGTVWTDQELKDRYFRAFLAWCKLTGPLSEVTDGVDKDETS